MTKRELLSVVVRLFAIGLALVILRALPASLSVIEAGSGWGHWAVSHALLAFIAWALWKFPVAVATLLLPTEDSPLAGVPWSKDDAIEMGSIVIGVFYLYYALSDAVYWLVYSIALARYQGGLVEIKPDEWAGIITTVFEVAAALLLIFGAKHIARLIHIVRYAGR